MPDSNLQDNNRILMVGLGQYVTNFCRKIVHCLFSMWYKDCNSNFVLMCHMSGGLVCDSQYLNAK